MEITKTTAKWMGITLKVANSFLGVNGFALLLYCIWMLKACFNEGRFSWFLLACVSTGSCLCGMAFMGYAVAANFGKEAWLTYHLILMLVFLLVEFFVGADINLNRDWQKDFPKDRTGLFDDFVDYVDSHSGTFRFIWLLVLLAQVTSFVIGAILKYTRLPYEVSTNNKLPLVDTKPSSASNKDVEN